MMDKKPRSMMILILVLIVISLASALKGVYLLTKIESGEATYSSMVQQYYSQAKSVRDSAATGSELNQQLAQIHDYTYMQGSMKALAFGKLMIGIFVLLLAILIAQLSMPKHLANEAFRHR